MGRMTEGCFHLQGLSLTHLMYICCGSSASVRSCRLYVHAEWSRHALGEDTYVCTDGGGAMKQCKASKGRVLATTVSEAQVKALWLDVCRNFLIPSFVDSALDHEGLPLNMQAAGLCTYVTSCAQQDSYCKKVVSIDSVLPTGLQLMCECNGGHFQSARSIMHVCRA